MTTEEMDRLSDEELLSVIGPKLRELMASHVDAEVDYEKTWQLLRIQEVDFYIRQLQFLELRESGGCFDWVPTTAENEGDQMLEYTLDIVDSYRKKYIATLGARPFYNVVAQPDDPQSELDRKAARQANLAAGWMRSKWNLRVRNLELFNAQYSAGTVYLYTPYVADRDIFGEITKPRYETVMKEEPGGVDPLTGMLLPPQQVPVTMQAGVQTYAASGPAFYLCSGDTVTVPFSCREFRKVPFLVYEYEENQGILLQLFGKVLRDKLNSGGELTGGGEETVGKEQGKSVRESAASLTGAYRSGLESVWTISRYWLATSMFEFFKDESIRELTYRRFPEGLKVSRVEGHVVKLENEKLTDVWGHVLPYPSKTIYHDPVAWPILSEQDARNHLINIRMAKLERGLPTAIGDIDLLDYDQLGNQRYLPNQIVPAKAAFGGSLREAIITLPTPNGDDGESDTVDGMFVQNVESGLGLFGAVYGNPNSKNETASGQRMEITQGLMQLGVPGELASQGYADAYTRGCHLIAKYAPEGFVVTVPDDPNGMTSEMLDLDALRTGHYHFEPAPSMPMSWAEKREQLNAILTQNAELAAEMGFMSPAGAASVRDLLLPDMEEIPDPRGDVRDKVVERIQQLLQQGPLPGTVDPLTGQPGPSMPSIMPEEYVDDFLEHAQMTREWMNSSPGRKASSDPQRSAGYQNVLAYGRLCAKMAIPPPMPVGPEGKPESIGPGGKPPEPPPQLAAGNSLTPPVPGAAPEMPSPSMAVQ